MLPPQNFPNRRIDQSPRTDSNFNETGNGSSGRGSLVPFVALLLWLFASVGAAQDHSRELEARELFEQGIQKADAGELLEAEHLFSRSRELIERPATDMNLVILYDRLARPLDVVAMVERLLRVMEPVRHESDRTRALALQAKAHARLGRIALTLLPGEASISVANSPFVVREDRTLILPPGDHSLLFSAPGYRQLRREVHVEAGSLNSLFVQLDPVQSAAAPREAASAAIGLPVVRSTSASAPLEAAGARWKPTLLAAFGLTALASALAMEASSIRRAQALSDADPFAPGYLDQADPYRRLSNTIAPVALAGGVTAAFAAGWYAHQSRRPRSRVTTAVVTIFAIAAASAGAALWIRSPGELGVTALPKPARPAAALLVSASLVPLGWAAGQLTRGQPD